MTSEETPAVESEHESSTQPDVPDSDRADSTPAVESPVVAPVNSGLTNRGVDRSIVIDAWLQTAARWSLRLILISIAVVALLWLLAKIWVGVLPVLLALIVTTVLYGPVSWLRRHNVPSSLAALVGLLVPFAIIGGIFTAIAPSVVRQSATLVDQAADGIRELQRWLQGPPINLQSEQVREATDEVVKWLQGSSTQIASGVFTTVGAVTSAMVTLVLVLVLTFFFLKDGHYFLEWVRRVSGRKAGRHLTEVCTRGWVTLSGFIRTQAIVSAVDAIFIGLGLVILQVPLAFALAILTFFGGFVPIVGAFTVGILAVLVALVSNGWVTALAVAGVIVVVQQLESNLLQPYLQGKSMQLHAGLILLAVAAGATLFGVIGAFLAVPFAAVTATTLRYISEQIDIRTGDLAPEDANTLTAEGRAANLRGAAESAIYQERERARLNPSDPDALT
ncbi:AI-2E family transporter [Nocardioides limicola]|uniref:AI-2E family transporter n=1 Tax=Nocardioides limicola TaxID=2803368 RepID=UPI00193B3639|nr:AI-2E family transporter [Nocardioides sp. DJM-14]